MEVKGTNIVEAPKEHFLYLNLINFIAPLYPKVIQKDLEILTKATYDYFCFILSLDDYFDLSTSCDKDEKIINLFNRIENCENSIRNLSLLFDYESLFWKVFKENKKTYMNTLLLEKSISKSEVEFSEELFLKIAKGKSSVSLNVIQALACLGEDKKFSCDLVDCINELHVALQYIDDIDDFKKDLKENQWTYPHSFLKKHLSSKSIEWSEIDLDTKFKYLFISDTATIFLNRAVCHYKNSIILAKELGLNEFVIFVNNQIRKTEDRIRKINFLLLSAKEN